MTNSEDELIILLPHLDDEFAFIPFLNSIASNKIKFTYIFCAERLKDPEIKRKKRRQECIKSISELRQNKYDIFFLNDFFPVEDLKLYLASKEIFSFILKKAKVINLKTIVTSNLEGGHPDHDALALIANEIQVRHNFKTKYFPLYNSRKTLGILPVSVLRPLESQMPSALKFSLDKFCWMPALRLIFIYKTEISAFMKIGPFILFKAIFSNTYYCFTEIDEKTVSWEGSLSATRYKTNPKQISQYIKKAISKNENLYFSK